MKRIYKSIITIMLIIVATCICLPFSSVADESEGLEVHFIDVGQGDCELVICDGHAMLIDGGKPAQSSKVYAYLKSHGITHLDYIVATHPHDDHVGGLSGALNLATVDTAWGTLAEYDNTAYKDFIKYLGRQNKTIIVPDKSVTYSLGSASIQVVGPIDTVDSLNNRSLVIRIVYGNNSFLFMGDAEREEEEDILNHGYDLKSDVMKLGHHGSDTSTTYRMLNDVMPSYAVIEVGENNTYGHPCESTLSKLRDEGAKVFRTDLQGDIVCKSDGTNITWSVEKNPDIDTLSYAGDTTQAATTSTQEQYTEGEFILNLRSKKFHRPDCGSVKDMKDTNRAIFSGDRQVIIDKGYVPCKNCNP